MPKIDDIIKEVKKSIEDYSQLKRGYPNAEKFLNAFVENVRKVAPPDPKDAEKSREFAMNRAFDIPGGLAGAIKAYHGSPHKFDAFDMSKIGTGEGAQAYGHGLYFAEHPAVAKEYRDKLTVSDNFVDGELLDAYNPKHYLASILDQESGNIDSAKEYLSFMADRGGSVSVKGAASEALKLLERGDLPKLQYIKPEGNLYKTSLEWPDAAREAADPLGPQHFLDWDKPLSEQTESVRQSLSNSEYEYGKLLGGGKIFNTSSPVKAGNAYDDLTRKLRPSGHITQVTGPGSGNSKGQLQDIVSKHLQDLGIPGIRYLDGGSRGAGEGSYNYVVFDDKIPKIVERNGQGLIGKPK